MRKLAGFVFAVGLVVAQIQAQTPGEYERSRMNMAAKMETMKPDDSYDVFTIGSRREYLVMKFKVGDRRLLDVFRKGVESGNQQWARDSIRDFKYEAVVFVTPDDRMLVVTEDRAFIIELSHEDNPFRKLERP